MLRNINEYLFTTEDYEKHHQGQEFLLNSRLRDESKSILDFLKSDDGNFTESPEGKAVLEGIAAFGDKYGK